MAEAALEQLMARFYHQIKTLFRSKVIFLIFLFAPFNSYAERNIEINSWQENTNLTSRGKMSEVLAQGKVKNVPKNQVMASFSIAFDKTRNLKIIDVICDGKDANFKFENNALQINFIKGKADGDKFLIYFSFDEKYDKVEKFLRQELIDIPSFAAGATAKVNINFPGYLDSATLNPNLKKESNSFIYSNIVPSDGVREMIKLTPSKNVWDVTIRTTINSAKGLNNATVFLPTYFENGGQKIENLRLTSSTPPIKQEKKDDKKVLKYKTENRTIIIENKARVHTGKNSRLLPNRNPSEYLEVESLEAALLTQTLENIRRDTKYGDIPLYAKIGKYVHDFIRYDESYIGKLPSISEILQNPVGVCSEYAKLFNSLARLAKIPSIAVDGAACGENDKCMGHAWNVIFDNGKWIEVDPTWDLMSGTVSSSHIYFNDDQKGQVLVKYFDDKESVMSKIDFEMVEAH